MTPDFETADSDDVRDPALSSAEHLLWLQLSTRKAMAEKRLASISRERKEESPQRPVEENQAPVIPQRWRLLGEDTRLHAWQSECLEIWLTKSRGTVKVATGGGKTVFALAAAQRLQNERDPQLRLVVVAPTISLMRQWRDELQDANLPSQAIGLMGGGEQPHSPEHIRILICVLNSARDRLSEFIRRHHWAEHMLLVVDECHRANANEARKIFDSSPAYTLGLSATPEQDAQPEDVPVEAAYADSPVGRALGEVIYNFSLQDSLKAGLLTPFDVWHIGLPLTAEEATRHARLSREISELRKELQRRHSQSRSRQALIAWCQTQASRAGPAASDAARFIGLANQRKRLLYGAETRAQLALELLRQSADDPQARAIVFHESISEIGKLFLAAQGIGLPVVLEHSELPEHIRTDSIETFRQGTARAIISAKSLVEGFNVPSADLGIIAAASASVRQRIQSLGRMLRRKPAGRPARIVVLYIRDTQDEEIYGKADWENVLGAKANRYFKWDPPEPGVSYESGLTETASAPRRYRPPSSEVDVANLTPGSTYPGQTTGLEIKVDHENNARDEEGQLIAVAAERISAILQQNSYRRARITPAGHLIVRVDEHARGEEDWRFLGLVHVSGSQDAGPSAAECLRIRQVSGRRVISRERGRDQRYALGPENDSSADAGRLRDQLLAWIQEQEAVAGLAITKLYWNGHMQYWVEYAGERHVYSCSSATPLEFRP